MKVLPSEREGLADLARLVFFFPRVAFRRLSYYEGATMTNSFDKRGVFHRAPRGTLEAVRNASAVEVRSHSWTVQDKQCSFPSRRFHYYPVLETQNHYSCPPAGITENVRSKPRPIQTRTTMELPSSLIANRDAFRRSLQSSLHDVLGDITLEGVNFTTTVPQVNLASSSSSAAAFSSHLPSSTTSSLVGPEPSSLLTSHHRVGLGAGSLLSQSLGAPSPSLASFGFHQDLLLAKAVAEQQDQRRHQQIVNQAKAALWQQTITAQQNHKNAVQEAYIQYLQNQLAATQAMQTATNTTTAGHPSHALLASLALQQAGTTTLGSSSAGPSTVLSSLRGATEPSKPSMVQQLPLHHQAPPSALATKQKIAQTLKALGTSLRSRYDPFIDCLEIEDPEEDSFSAATSALTSSSSTSNRRSRGGVSEHFPERLHRMLLDVELEGHSDVVSFYSHGRAFGVHDMDRFINEIMPKYFKQSKWNSFARQLNLYGFMRLASGPDAGGYYHELFLRGRPSLARYMRRVGVPQGQQDRRKCRPKNVVDIQEPDFYSMRPSNNNAVVAVEKGASAVSPQTSPSRLLSQAAEEAHGES